MLVEMPELVSTHQKPKKASGFPKAFLKLDGGRDRD